MKELFRLAKEKGFENSTWEESKDSEPDVFYLWMCLLQKWLRDEKKIVVDVYQESKDFNYTGMWKVDRSELGHYQEEEFPNPIILKETYEQALEAGLLEALKLI